MADEIDITQDRSEALMENTIRELRRKVTEMPAGEPGDCDLCGEWSGRLVAGVCAPCRDRRRLP